VPGIAGQCRAVPGSLQSQQPARDRQRRACPCRAVGGCRPESRLSPDSAGPKGHRQTWGTAPARARTGTPSRSPCAPRPRAAAGPTPPAPPPARRPAPPAAAPAAHKPSYYARASATLPNATAPEPAGAPHSCPGLIRMRPTADALRKCGASKTARVPAAQRGPPCKRVRLYTGRGGAAGAAAGGAPLWRGRGAGTRPSAGASASRGAARLASAHARPQASGRLWACRCSLAMQSLAARAQAAARSAGRCLRRARAATRARTAARLCVRSTARGAAGRAPCRTSRA